MKGASFSRRRGEAGFLILRSMGFDLTAIGVVALLATAVATCAANTEGRHVNCMAGTIRDSSGKPIVGAQIKIEGTAGLGDAEPVLWQDRTDANGRYLLCYGRKIASPVIILGLRVGAPGFVRLDPRFLQGESTVVQQGINSDEIDTATSNGTVKMFFVNNQLARWEGPLPQNTPILKPDTTNIFDMVLAPGEVLAGKVEMPDVFPYKNPEVKAEDRKFSIIVRGTDFEENYATEKGGSFKLWVPRGDYSLELQESWPEKVRIENVRSGTENLILLKADPPLTSEQSVKAFDALWDDMNTNYSYFALKKIDWLALRGVYRPKAAGCTGVGALCDVLLDMLTQLHDGHIWLEMDGVHGYTGFRPAERTENYNPDVVERAIEDGAFCGNFAMVGKVKGEGFGAFIMLKQSAADEEGVQEAIRRIQALKDVPGFIVDLRNANGGDELLARKIASLFCAHETVYAKSKYRAGPAQSDFGQVFERSLSASERPFTKPVVCLLGFRCVSSGEGFAEMMSCLTNVTTIGEPTRGSSGNPRPFKIPGIGVTVYYSRWVDMMPDETPIEDAGVIPKVLLNFPQKAYEGADPTWDAAVALLRKLTRESK